MARRWLCALLILISTGTVADANFGRHRLRNRVAAYQYVPAYYSASPVVSYSLLPMSIDYAPAVPIPAITSGAVVFPLESAPPFCEEVPQPCDPVAPLSEAPPQHGAVLPSPAPIPATIAPPPADPVTPPITPGQTPMAIPQTAPPSPESQLPPLPSNEDSSSRKPTVSEASRTAIVSAFIPAKPASTVTYKTSIAKSRSEYRIYPRRLTANMPPADLYSVTLWNLTKQPLRLSVHGTSKVLARGKSVTVELPRTFAWQVEGYQTEVSSVPEGEQAIMIAIRK